MPSPSVLAKAPYKIPAVVDTDRVCVSVSCPNDADHLANLYMAIASLGLWSNYRLEPDRRAKPVADIWMSIFETVDQSMCDCGLRNGPNGLQQWDADLGAWVDIQGNSAHGDPRTDGTVPPPYTSVPVGQTAQCLAAANIIDTFKAQQKKANDILVAAGYFAELVLGIEAMFELVLPIIGEVILIAQAMAAAATAAGAAVWTEVFVTPHTPDPYNYFKCAIDCHASATGAITAAAVTGIKTQLDSHFPFGLSTPDAILFQAIAHDFLDANGPNGLTKLANFSGIVTADCSDCTDCLWCHVLDFRISDYGFLPQPGVTPECTWVNGLGWVAPATNPNVFIYFNFPSTTTLNQASYDYTDLPAPNPASGGGVRIINPASHQLAQVAPFIVGFHHFDGPSVSYTADDLYIQTEDSDATTLIIHKLWISGTGFDPFESTAPFC
jgi:hypothetical protein